MFSVSVKKKLYSSILSSDHVWRPLLQSHMPSCTSFDFIYRGATAWARVGRYDRSDRLDGFDNLRIVGEIPHPLFVDDSFEFDFLLLRLSGVSDNQVVTMNSNSAVPVLGQSVQVAGFGNTDPPPNNETGFPNILQEATVYVISNDECQMSEGPGFSYLRRIYPEMICAKDTGVDTCQGDSGGPLLLLGALPQDDVQLGVVSW
jgi:hypothetical protein